MDVVNKTLNDGSYIEIYFITISNLFYFFADYYTILLQTCWHDTLSECHLNMPHESLFIVSQNVNDNLYFHGQDHQLFAHEM